MKSGWRLATDTDPSFFVTPSGEKLRGYEFIDKQGDTLHIDCVEKPLPSLIQSINNLLAVKVQNKRMKTQPLHIGNYAGVLVLRWPRNHAKILESASFELLAHDRDGHAGDYISAIAEYNRQLPTPTQIATLEQILASVKIGHGG